MLVLTHVLIALSSLVYTTYLLFRPSRSGMKTAYGLVAATLISGTYLVVSTHSQLLSACVTGLAYLAGVSFGLVMVRYRLVAQESKTNKLS